MPRALALAAIALAACIANEPGIPIEEEDQSEPVALLSSVNVADPRAEPQLLRGFHGLEQQAWRWTERQFAVLLQPPPPGQPVILHLGFTLPGVVSQAVGPVTITARLSGQQIGQETFADPGESLQLEAAVPPELLAGRPVEVEFELDRAMPPGDHDPRELGVIASTIAFQ